MRKFIATGLGALALTSGLAIGAASPAGAVAVIPGICATLPAQIVAANAALTVAANGTASAAATLSTKTGTMNVALASYAAAVGDWLRAVDSGTGIPTAEALMNTRLSDLAAKISDWSAARAAHFAAEGVQSGAQATVDLVNAFQSNLCS